MTAKSGVHPSRQRSVSPAGTGRGLTSDRNSSVGVHPSEPVVFPGRRNGPGNGVYLFSFSLNFRLLVDLTLE